MTTSATEPCTVETLRRVDAACDHFEDAWNQGLRPRVEDYLANAPPSERKFLLTTLQSLQQELLLAPSATVPAEHREEGHLPASATARNPSFLASSVAADTSTTNSNLVAETPKDEASSVTLRVIEGPNSGKAFTLSTHEILLAGRTSKAQIRLANDPHFSRHHFRLEVNPPTCFLMDLHSRNGTFVNGVRATERFLNDGDIISGGKTKLSVVIRSTPDKPTVRRAGSRNRPSTTQVTNGSSPAVTAPFSPLLANRTPEPALKQSVKNASDAVMAPMPDVAGYQLHELLGTGDLGSVYRATHLASQTSRALKVLQPGDMADEVAVQAFLREATILRQLNHLHIVRAQELGSSGSILFVATEYVSTTAWEELSRTWDVARRIRNAVGLMRQILSALAYAHGLGYVHRDIKPSNILISRPERQLIAKLADFGLAKQFMTAGMSQITRDGAVIGSLPFMSPDQFMNSREARPTCDIYSAGATLYYWLTGREPIPMDKHPCKFLALLEEPPTPIQQYLPEVPRSLADVIHRSLSKSPEQRYRSALEMRTALKCSLDV